ncbi:MAG TPA: DUF502 domain-containing protein [Nitrospirota bacterium]|nr:DUF502 domain-containing protein [Nitrospirota bacterium]
MKKIRDFFKKYFITGLLVIIPVWATFYVLRAILGWIDGMLGPLLGQYLELRFPGVGIVTLFLVILIVGVLSANYIGRRFVKYSDVLLQKVPLVRGVYTTVKKIMETFSMKQNFHGVALVEYPRKGCYSVGFVTGDVRGESVGLTGKFMTVFVPTTPNPTAGFLLILPENEVTQLDMSVEDGMQFIISIGLVPMNEVKARKLTHPGQEAL